MKKKKVTLLLDDDEAGMIASGEVLLTLQQMAEATGIKGETIRKRGTTHPEACVRIRQNLKPVRLYRLCCFIEQ